MQQRGLDESQEMSPQLLLRDTRTLGMKAVDFFKDPVKAASLIVMIGVGVFLLPAFSDFITLIGVGVFWYAYTRKHKLPFFDRSNPGKVSK